MFRKLMIAAAFAGLAASVPASAHDVFDDLGDGRSQGCLSSRNSRSPACANAQSNGKPHRADRSNEPYYRLYFD